MLKKALQSSTCDLGGGGGLGVGGDCDEMAQKPTGNFNMETDSIRKGSNKTRRKTFKFWLSKGNSIITIIYKSCFPLMPNSHEVQQ